MAAANVVINNQIYAPIRNPRADYTAMEHIVADNKTTYIAYRLLQLSERVCKAAAMVFVTMTEFLSGIASKLLTAWTWLIFMRLPEVTQKAWNAITTWGTVEGPEGYALHGHIERVHDFTDCVASWFYALSLVFSSTPFKNAGDAVDLGSHVTDLAGATDVYNMAGKHLEHIQVNEPNNAPLADRFAETKRGALLLMLKSVFSIASTTLGLLALYLGGPVLSAAALLAISLFATGLALAAHIYKETAVYKPVKFFEWIQPPVNGVRIN